MNFKNLTLRVGLGITSAMSAISAFAEDGVGDLERVGKPIQDGMWMQPAIGDQAVTTNQLNNILFWLSGIVVLFVTVLLIIVVIKFRDTGKEPRRFTHNTPLEIAWTLVPVLILVVLGVYSVPALLKQTRIPVGEVVIKATGNQWFWSYEYPEAGIAFDSYMLEKKDLAAFGYMDDEYLLAVDNAVIVPVNTDVVVQITASDVIHSWKIPAFAVASDAVPGRTMEQWFNATKEGIYFGQCSQLCGKSHAYMPIVVKVVSKEVYEKWVAEKKKSASIAPTIQIAAN